MIVTMKKAVLVTTVSKKEASIKKLRDFGLLHLEQLQGRGEKLEELISSREMVERAIYSLAVEKDVPNSGINQDEAALEMARRINRQTETIREVQEEIDRLQRERDRLLPWGDFDPLSIKDLEKHGYPLRLYELSQDQASSLGDAFYWFAIRTTKTEKYIAVLENEYFCSFLQEKGWKEFALPERSLSELERNIQQKREQLDHIKKELDLLSANRSRLVALKKKIDGKIEFENVLTGMDGDGSIVYLQGFLPENSCKDLKQLASENGMGLLLDDPSQDDAVPTLIKNPKAVSIIQPVFDMLGTIPGYRERDTSIFFLIFLTIFFAMIIGDAGYGFVFLLPAIFGIQKGKKKTGKAPVAMVFLAVMGAATVIWGAITGTWFGSQSLAEMPIFKALTIPQIASFGNQESSELIKFICFVLGTIHVSIAHIWNFIDQWKKKPRIRAFAQLGWLSMVLGLFYLVLNLVLSAEQYPMPQFSLFMIFGGLAGVFIFSQQEGKFFQGIIKGISGVLPTFLDSISAFSDIISYIRLFAVGLASVEIAKSFNAMASGLGNDAVGIIGAVFILLLGHSLNIAMGALSVVVHGVRLNMLEFSSHLGMEWTGIAYDPFRKKETK